MYGYSRFLANTGAAWKTGFSPWKTGFSHQVTSQGRSKMELFSWKNYSTLMTSLNGKNQFSMECLYLPKPRNSQPCNLSNVWRTILRHHFMYQKVYLRPHSTLRREWGIWIWISFLKLDHFFRPSFYWTKTGFEPTSECWANVPSPMTILSQ